MSFSTVAVGGAKEDLIVDIPATDSVGQSAGATPELNLTGATGSTVFWVEVDCRDNQNENGQFRLYDTSGTPSLGTDGADILLRGIRGKKITYNFPVGVIFANDINAVYAKGEGGLSSPVDPTGTVKIKLGLKV